MFMRIFEESLLIFALLLLNGFFAMAELAVVSARRARLQPFADRGHRGAQVALYLAKQPGRFLSTVQIGITLIGILAGAFGGATLARELGHVFAAWPSLAPHSEMLAFGLVVTVITYLSLIIGELVPKQLALKRAERIAMLVARPMATLAWLAAPLVSLLEMSTRLGLRLLGVSAAAGQTVSDEEIKSLIAEAADAGVVERAEQQMISGVMRFADRSIQKLMTPRPNIIWLDLADDPEAIKRTLQESTYSRFPVARGNIDEVLGIVQVRDMLNQSLAGEALDLERLLREPLIVAETAKALRVLEILKESPLHMALIVDEYGSVQGLITATDILEAIVGELNEPGSADEAAIVAREDGSWLIDGGLPVDELQALLKLRELPDKEHIHTLAGLVLDQLTHVPVAGEHFEFDGYRFEVVDMDGLRIDKVLINNLPASQIPPRRQL